MGEQQNKLNFNFSVIMAIYDVEPYLEVAIESVINQTVGFKENIQLILVNDGSLDNSEEICKKYESMYPENVIYLKKKNGGVSSARNMGLEYATGKYINFLDSDDYFSENCFEEVKKVFDENDIDVVAVNLINFENSEGTWINGNYFKKKSQIIDMNKEPNFMQCQVGASFIKNEFAKKYRFDENIKIHEDSHYLYRIFATTPKCGTIGSATYWHRIRQNKSSATQNINHKKNMYELTKRVFNSLIKFNLNYNHYVPDYLQTFIILEFNYYVMNNLKDGLFTKEEIKPLKREIKILLKNITKDNINNHFVLTADEKNRLLETKKNIKNIDRINQNQPLVKEKHILKNGYYFIRRIICYLPKRILRRILRSVLKRIEYLENSNVENIKNFNQLRNEHIWEVNEMKKVTGDINNNKLNTINAIIEDTRMQLNTMNAIIEDTRMQFNTTLHTMKVEEEKIQEKVNTQLNEIKNEIGLYTNNSSINYCLYFHNGSNNHGCEAIIKSLATLLKVDRDKTMLHTFRKNEDIQFNINEYIKFIEEPTLSNPNGEVAYMGNCVFNKEDMGLQTVIPKLDKNAIAISIGGDNYCYGEYIQTLLANYNTFFQRNGIRTALIGCSIEPELLENQDIVKDLNRYSLILARETTTYNALIEKGINKNTHLAPDPAFTLLPIEVNLPKEFSRNNTIGINISPLVINEEKEEDVLLANTKNLIKYIVEHTSYNILLIPHVAWEKSNDLEILTELYNEFCSTGRIGLVPNYNCQQLKYIISKCKIFIGARTHSIIAAYSSCVPAIAIGYSMKAKAIAKDIFGTTDNYVIEAANLKDKEEFIKKFKWMDNNYSEIKSYLNEFMPEYIEKTKNIPDILKTAIKQPILELAEYNECTACTACYNICPNKCITMKDNEEGFKYPVIDLKKCTHCNLCAKVCPANKKYVSKFPIEAYAAKNKDDLKRKSSSSGGTFIELAEYVINNSGVVFGAAYNVNNEVEHVKIEKVEDIKKLQGSKYVQSNLNNTYKEVKKCLKQGKLVLFTGVPCQIQGLKSFLKNDYNNLICVDVICHGVPSPKILKKYLSELETKYESKIINVDFRFKQESWKNYKTRITFANGKEIIENFDKNIYMRGFLRNMFLRKSCYQCMAKEFKNESDITIGDYWGIENVDSKFDDDKGCSTIIINTNKGKEIFNKIKEKFEIKNSKIEDIILGNKYLIDSVEETDIRKLFFDEIKENNEIEQIIKKQLGD